jgi:hypothetical protein
VFLLFGAQYEQDGTEPTEKPVNLKRNTFERPKKAIFLHRVLGVVAASLFALLGSSPEGAQGRSFHGRSAYDGPWHLSFTTQAGSCDSAYDFDVNIANGIITHPNLVRFTGDVQSNGMVRASVAVQGKYAFGSGRLGPTAGKGVWKGRSGSALCSGYWTAERS